MEATQVGWVVGVGHVRIVAREGDITVRLGDVPVVSSDDNYLSHGGGVSAAIWAAAGDTIAQDPHVQAVVRGGPRPRAGDVVESRADGVTVLHAITLDFDRGERVTTDRLVSMYQRLLDVAYDEAEPTIAMPLLGTGSAGISPEASAAMLVRAAASRARLPLRVDVELWAYDSETMREVWPVLTAGQRPPVSFRALADDHPEPVRQAAAALDETDRTALVERSVTLFTAVAPDDGATLSSELRRTIRRGVEARNRLVSYDPHGAEVSLVADVLRACAALLANSRPATAPPSPYGTEVSSRDVDLVALPRDDQLADLDLPRPMVAPPDDTDAGTHPVVGDPRLSGNDGGEEALAVQAPTSISIGTEHVRALRDLLVAVLDDHALAAEHDRLLSVGYRGEARDCLLESCAHEDPRDTLLHLLSGRDLRRVLALRGVNYPPNDPPARLATRLLEHLGFPLPRDAVDPETLRTQVQVLKTEVSRLDRAAITGHVTSLSQELELLLRLYLRFLCLGVLHERPDQWLGRTQQLSGDDPDRLTLGGLVTAIRLVGREIDGTEDAKVVIRARAARGELEPGRPWIAGRAHQVASLRNALVHRADTDRTPAALARLREDAASFLDALEATLTHLMDGPYPKVVVVEQVNFDRWGRRRIAGRTPAGRSEEIFTDESLQPGETYLMRAQSNPLRVDPILVPAGRKEEKLADAGPGGEGPI